MAKSWGDRLKQLCYEQHGSASGPWFTLDEPLYVQIWHRRVFDTTGKPVEQIVIEDYAIKGVSTNCFWGDKESAKSVTLPWWAVMKFKVEG